MKAFVALLSSLIFGNVALAETVSANSWKVGLDFEQQAYMRQGIMVERAYRDSDIFLGATIGSQNAVMSDPQGRRSGRKAVDYGAYIRGDLALTSNLHSRLGLLVGYQSLHNGSSFGSTGYGFFDLSQGFGVNYGRIEFFTDLALRNCFFGSNKDLQIGDRRADSTSVYPRLGFSFAL